MPLYKKIKVDSSLDSCDILPYNDYRLELFCPECKKINKQIAHSECKFTDFAENCKMKFPNNKVIYDGGEMYNVRVKLKCEIHGEFTVNTNYYYNYFGMCPECLKLEIKERFKHQSDFDAEIYKNVME